MIEERFRFAGRLWNVSLAKELTAERDATQTVAVALQYEAWLTGRPHNGGSGGVALPSGDRWVVVDEIAAMSDRTNLNVPLIAADIGPSYFIIDGWHRIYKAYHQGVGALPCKVLTPEESQRCEIHG